MNKEKVEQYIQENKEKALKSIGEILERVHINLYESA